MVNTSVQSSNVATVNTGVNNSNVTTQIEFVQFHQPGLPPGDYTITVQQNVTIPSSSVTDAFDIKKSFAVYGDRFSLNPQVIHAVFPPDSSLGEHSNILPHIIFTRSTLPWERQAQSGNNDVPWLALLLFDDQEKPPLSVIALSELENPTGFSAKFPAVTLESGQQPTDLVAVIDVEKRLLQNLLPAPNVQTLAWLAHARIGTYADGSQNELAVVIGNRLPARGATSTVHLVSLEGRYTNNSFDYQNANDTDLIRLVSLKNWSFTCVDEKQSFTGLLENLDHTPGTLRLPQNKQPAVEQYLAMGYTLLPHTFRESGKTFSWYHGPLVPLANTTEPVLPVQAADALVRYDSTNGLFDISYAAAWQLGRLLALQSKQLSINLFLWKRTHAQLLQQAEQQLLHAYLPLRLQPVVDTSELYQRIASWFAKLGLLQGIPFNYLVPDARLLPKEAIRFFQVDHLWVDYLLDGAFSIGRVTSADFTQDKAHVANNSSPASNPFDTVTGFLLRSDVVAGWPGLQANGYDKGNNELPLLRMDHLSPNVLLCLFDGEIDSVAIHQKPETLHFGFDQTTAEPPTFYKILRNSQGNEQPDLRISPIPWLQEAQRIIDMSRLAQSIKQETNANSFTSAQFALQMIEGVEEVIFQKG